MRKVLLFALAASLIVASPAAAATNAPSGNSGLSQYLEVVPGSSGNTPSKGGANQHVLGASARAALNDRGNLGRSLAEFADKTAPARPKAERKGNEDADGKINALAAGVTGGGSSGAMGLWLPILIAAAAALAIYAGYRQKSSHQGQ